MCRLQYGAVSPLDLVVAGLDVDGVIHIEGLAIPVLCGAGQHGPVHIGACVAAPPLG